MQETKVQDPDFPAAAFQEAGYHVVFRRQKACAGVLSHAGKYHKRSHSA
jgi:exonuclease III